MSDLLRKRIEQRFNEIMNMYPDTMMWSKTGVLEEFEELLKVKE